MMKWFNWIVGGCLVISVIVFITFHYQKKTTFTAKCIKVFDCKRIIVWLDNQLFYNRMKIQLSDVQCPERTYMMGKQAREDLKNIIYGKIIDIEIVKSQFFGWSEAVIYCNGVCINTLIQTRWKK